MRRICFALAVAALAAAAMPSSAQAYCRGCAVGAGVVGGLAAGAIIGSAIANSAPPVYYVPAPVYSAPPPPPEYVEGPACHIEKQRVWYQGYGWRWRRVEVCD